MVAAQTNLNSCFLQSSNHPYSKDMDLDFYNQYFNLIDFMVLCLFIGLIYLCYNYKSLCHKKIPPGKKGLPFIGETLDYAMAARRGTPEKFIADRMSKHSPELFRTSLFGENTVVFCGASGNKALFSGYDKNITSWWPYCFKKIQMDPADVKNSANEEAVTMRSYLPSFLNPGSLKIYIPVMDSMAKQHLQKEWSPNKQVKVFPLSKKYTFSLACRLFVSVEDPQHVSKLAEPFARIAEGLISLPINLPGLTFNRAMKAGKRIPEELKAIVNKRKLELEENNNTCPPGKMDLLTSMLLDGLSETEIANKIGGFFVANYDTSSVAITFIIYFLVDHPDVHRKVFEEQMEILKSKGEREHLNWHDVEKMKYSWCVACEVMRILPPASLAFREALRDFTYAGYTIPKGWKAIWNAYTIHKNPKYFPEPEKFDPSRFEGNGPPPFSFVPFGGGPRMCPGKEFARLKMLVFMHNVVTKFKWEKLIPDEEVKYTGPPFPAHGLPVSSENIHI